MFRSRLKSLSCHIVACSQNVTCRIPQIATGNGQTFNLNLKKVLCTSSKCFQDISATSDGGVSSGQTKGLVKSIKRPIPIIVERKLKFLNSSTEPKQAWLESLETVEDNKVGLIDLHPDIFGAHPRIDMVHKNIVWQKTYRKIDYDLVLSRAEKRGGGKKPWPQKRMGKARHGSIRSPLWHRGGKAFAPRGPRSSFYMLNDSTRTHGLCVALSIKLAQNNLLFVDSLEMPSDEQEYLEDLVDTRYWGFSVLFVDDTDFMPRNISLAVADKQSFTLMPVYGLNVYSILKYEKVVLTLAAVEKIEEKLLYQLNRTKPQKKYQVSQV